MPEAVYLWLSGGAGGLAILAALGYLWRRLRKFFTTFDNFHEDWYGKPARPEEGVPARKGVMLRLKEQDDILVFLKHELSLNGGTTTLKDVVLQSRNDIQEIKKAIVKE